jgi:hypothetical protein
MSVATNSPGFDPATLTGLEEPVRRYFLHALAEGAPVVTRVRLRIRGRIKVGTWLRFDSVWEGDGRSLDWRAICGPGALRALRVHDHFADGTGFMDIRLRPGLKLLHAADDDIACSSAGRAALESLWVPGSLLPERGVSWRAESDHVVVATFDVPPERPEIRFELGPEGGVRSQSAMRWQGAKTGYVPFGVDVQAEGTFDGVTIPSRVLGGWGHGTPRWTPSFDGEVYGFEPLRSARSRA